MLTPVQAAVAFAEMFRRDVLAPAMISQSHALGASIFQTIDPIPFSKAKSARYKPVGIGYEWGPAWSTAWFKLKGKVPASMAGKPVALRFSTDTEALLWLDGAPSQGLDVNRDTAPVLTRGSEQNVELLVEAACNHPFGAEGLQWDPPDVHHRWASATPGRFRAADLVVIEEPASLLYCRFTFATQLLRELPPDSPRAGALIALLRHVCAAVNDASVTTTAPAMAELLSRELQNGAGGSATLGYAAGHAHIDTAWLWPLRETRRKCLRTFANVLGLMDHNPEFVFMCSQAQQYAFVEEDSPTLFRRIAARVKEGRWEPTGGMWIEPDCNCVSGESLARQVLHGTRYWASRFGDKGRQRMLYLPDTFGFPACLPQVMQLSGLDTFITNKMIWNDTTLPPHTNFVWRGLGGAEVLAHFTPGHDYNNTNTPKELRHAESKHEGKSLRVPLSASARASSFTNPPPGSVARFFHPFGFGDGGGGPTAAQIENLRLSRDSEGLPRMKMATSGQFCSDLARDFAACRNTTAAWPVWDGELYLELHRGTYTTQAAAKAANLAAEQSLRVAELLLVARGDAAKQDRAALDEAWRLALLNQFHDILPGSSINWVYKDTAAQHVQVQSLASEVINRAAASLAPPAAAGNPAPTAILVNPSSVEVTRVLDVRGKPRAGLALAPSSVNFIDRAPAVSIEPSRAVKAVWSTNTCELSCGPLHVVVAKSGEILSFSRDGIEVASAADGRGMNQLALYRDRPKMWDAWDVDEAHADAREHDSVRVADFSPIDLGAIRRGVLIKGTIGSKSSFEQEITVDARPENDCEHTLRIVTRVNWQESHRILRALFPTRLRPSHAIYGTQFGTINRPTRRSTAAERAAFEVPGAGWMGFAEPGRMLQLVVPGKYGFSAHDGTMGVSLLRSPTYPDPQADRGEHTLKMYLALHDDNQTGSVLAEQSHPTPLEAAINLAETLMNPPVLIALRGKSARRRTPLAECPPVSLVAARRAGHHSTAVPIVSAVKLAEESSDIIVRLYEAGGGRGPVDLTWLDAIGSVQAVDLLERPLARSMPRPAVMHERSGNHTTVHLEPGQIVTLLGRRG